MKQALFYNKLARCYNRSRKKLMRLAVAGKNIRKQDILHRRIIRLYSILTGLKLTFKKGVTAATFASGMILLPDTSPAQSITFNPSSSLPSGLLNIGIYSAPTFADLDNDGDLDLLVGESYGNFYYFENTGTATVPAFAAPQINPFGLGYVATLPIPSFVDLDGDGDMDIMIGESYGHFFYFENTGTPSSPAFGTAMNDPFNLTGIGGYSAPAFADIDADGDLDLLAGETTSFFYFENVGTLTTPDFSIPQINPFGLTVNGIYNTPVFADLDHDGDKDILAGEGPGNFNYFENTGSAVLASFSSPVTNPFGLANIGSLYSTPAFADLDGDADLDLLSGDDQGNFHYYENTTTIDIKDQEMVLSLSLFPNPAIDIATLEFYTPEIMAVDVSIFDLSGRKIITLMHEKQIQGKQSLPISIRTFSKGIYNIKLSERNGLAKNIKLTVI